MKVLLSVIRQLVPVLARLILILFVVLRVLTEAVVSIAVMSLVSSSYSPGISVVGTCRLSCVVAGGRLLGTRNVIISVVVVVSRQVNCYLMASVTSGMVSLFSAAVSGTLDRPTLKLRLQ